MTETQETSVACSVENGLARITLNRPEKGNPIDTQFVREMRQIAIDLANRTDLRVVLITSLGKYFSVGGDIKLLTEERSRLPGHIRSLTADLHTAVSRFARMDAPIIAAVQGDVAGGSLAFVAGADIIYAATGARFSAAFPMIGFSADSGATVSLPARMGYQRAKRFLLMAETLSAEEARATGLVDFVIEPDSLQAEAEATALKLAAGATHAYGGIKRTMLASRMNALEAQLENEIDALAAIGATDDAWEGLTAFAQRRKPVFTGK